MSTDPSDSDGDSGSRNSTRIGPAYQGGLEAVLSVVVSMGLGVLADSYFDTSPVFLFVGLGVGFGAFILRLWRLTQELAARAAGGSSSDGDGGGDGVR